MMYRTLPVEVEAREVPDPNTNPDHTAVGVLELAVWCGGKAYHVFSEEEGHHRVIHVPTLRGVMEAKAGDYIVKNGAGEFYAVKPSQFTASHTPAV